MKKWMLEWCDSIEGFHDKHDHGKEVFDTKEELLDKLDELKGEYGETLEYEFGKAKQIMMPKWIFVSDLKKEGKLEIPKMLFESDEIRPTILDFV